MCLVSEGKGLLADPSVGEPFWGPTGGSLLPGVWFAQAACPTLAQRGSKLSQVTQRLGGGAGIGTRASRPSSACSHWAKPWLRALWALGTPRASGPHWRLARLRAGAAVGPRAGGLQGLRAN